MTKENVYLSISGLEAACTRVQKIDAIQVKQQEALVDVGANRSAINEPASLDFGNLSFSIPQTAAQAFYDWFHDFVVAGHNDVGNERSGTLTLLSPNRQTVLFTLTFANLGIFKLTNLPPEQNSARIALARVELYCEKISFAWSPLAVTDFSANAAKENTERREGSFTTPRSVAAGAVRSPEGAILPNLVAARLQATATRPAPAVTTTPRLKGIMFGERWAAEKASLEELELVAGLETDEWESLPLKNGNSLLDQLKEDGILLADADPQTLERDAFIEGIVTGAARVLNKSKPFLDNK